MKTSRDPSTVHPPLAAYTHQIEISGAERLLFVSGQVGMTPDGQVPDDPIEQLGVALDNVERNLEAAGMQLGDLVKLVVYLVGDWDNDARRALVAARMGTHRPCMTAIWVSALAGPTLRVELDAWASRAA
ncbi:MAG TPA: RidA family protein [Gaiellales bacterium]|jgi:enamine deaminase RidA (YjgF/YER057c/UK114 family)|nr:RidA family protein [Gaiellales bacterium]